MWVAPEKSNEQNKNFSPIWHRQCKNIFGTAQNLYNFKRESLWAKMLDKPLMHSHQI